MDSTIGINEMAHSQQTTAAVAAPAPEDTLAFFQALWFWIPAGLGLWSAIIWGITRII